MATGPKSDDHTHACSANRLRLNFRDENCWRNVEITYWKNGAKIFSKIILITDFKLSEKNREEEISQYITISRFYLKSCFKIRETNNNRLRTITSKTNILVEVYKIKSKDYDEIYFNYTVYVVRNRV